MDRALLPPFVGSLGDTFTTMLNCELHTNSKQPFISPPRFYDVSGIISLSGKTDGMVVVSLTLPVALKAASALLMMETTEMNGDVIDAVGEITNMVAGAAKAKLEHMQLRIGLPSVVTGAQHEVKLPTHIAPICLGFESEWGPLTLTVGMAPVEALVPANV